MKKLLLIIVIGVVITSYVQAANKIAIVNMNILFQHLAQITGISTILEKEFKDRANELQLIENDLQNKIQHLQINSSTMKTAERNKLEKDVMVQRQILSQKAESFEQDRQRRSNEERNKLITRIQTAVKQIATNSNIDLVIDTNIVMFNNDNIQNITDDVLKQVK